MKWRKKAVHGKEILQFFFEGTTVKQGDTGNRTAFRDRGEISDIFANLRITHPFLAKNIARGDDYEEK